MDRKKDATGFRDPGWFRHQLLPALGLLALMVLLAVLLGCQKQMASGRVPQEVRPAIQTSRLIQNAEYLRKSGHLELAVEELEKARLQKPDDLEILDSLAQCYEGLGHFERARELYDQALSQTGHHPALENNRCYSLYLQGRLNQAESCFRKVLDREPDNQTARNNLGLVLCRLGREAEALTLWQEASSETEARQLLGQALAALGRETPPHLAGMNSTPADQQTVAADKPAATSVPEQQESQTPLQAQQQNLAPAQARSVSSAPLAGPSPEHSLITVASASPRPKETPQPPAASTPAPAATPADRLVEEKSPPTPQSVASPQPPVPAEPQTTAAASGAGKEKSSAAADTSTVEKSAADSTPRLTALDLREAGIELKNGNGIQGCARHLKNLLSREGFNIVAIGNHIDFGLEDTTIAYRSEAAGVAKILAQKFFPEAILEANGKTSGRADIRVSLGHDLAVGQGPKVQDQEQVAADESAPLPSTAPVTKAPSKKITKADPPSTSSTAAATSPESVPARPPHKMRVELRNGNGVQGQAHKMRKLLREEGFKVINIGNCKDYGLQETVIAYRPEAAKLATILSQKFFSGANLEERGNLPFWLDIRVLMGRDLVADQEHLAQLTP